MQLARGRIALDSTCLGWTAASSSLLVRVGLLFPGDIPRPGGLDLAHESVHLGPSSIIATIPTCSVVVVGDSSKSSSRNWKAFEADLV